MNTLSTHFSDDEMAELLSYCVWPVLSHAILLWYSSNKEIRWQCFCHTCSSTYYSLQQCMNTLRPIQNGQTIFSNAFSWINNVWISLKTSLNFVPKVWINNISALVQIMAWHWPVDKPLYESIMLLMHICHTWPQWVNTPHNCNLGFLRFAIGWIFSHLNTMCPRIALCF